MDALSTQRHQEHTNANEPLRGIAGNNALPARRQYDWSVFTDQRLGFLSKRCGQGSDRGACEQPCVGSGEFNRVACVVDAIDVILLHGVEAEDAARATNTPQRAERTRGHRNCERAPPRQPAHIESLGVTSPSEQNSLATYAAQRRFAKSPSRSCLVPRAPFAGDGLRNLGDLITRAHGRRSWQCFALLTLGSVAWTRGASADKNDQGGFWAAPCAATVFTVSPWTARSRPGILVAGANKRSASPTPTCPRTPHRCGHLRRRHAKDNIGRERRDVRICIAPSFGNILVQVWIL